MQRLMRTPNQLAHLIQNRSYQWAVEKTVSNPSSDLGAFQARTSKKGLKTCAKEWRGVSILITYFTFLANIPKGIMAISRERKNSHRRSSDCS